ncbi:ATP-binding cassette transporter [Operophtera brumata]|uniref:ATP-binding cassette transporter n=1 Tax=Operophtera brumata TaxID=104452 RepID=A0A0L7LSF5_OPEBR|nr:ATP-binding cassette transporter [Operophtera brumata]
MLAEALSFAPSFAAARRSAARILSALARSPAIVTEPGAVECPDWSCTGEVSFSELQFRYPSRPETPVLRGLSLRLRAGRTLALGYCGSGFHNITFTQLLIVMRGQTCPVTSQRDEVCVYPQHLDGLDVKRSLTLRQLRAQLGLVSQEPALFERSLRDNIAYGDTARDVTMHEIIHAAKQANVHSFITSLPQGYDTVLGQGGAALSGGQKQRVAIARALAVQAALEVASRDRSTIIIAHRLATVRHAHTICVIDKGNVPTMS